ncbi:hypothetical protein BS47DRAFT_1376401 [Hydnum rufescens UP504]|uniref:TPR-like protein n=1 Tax=Hydnum rufescens UP504 TaxID=1448309 RepID=A0A9P6B077_9AGAM|nr:hypothetical protein BS47DRAFT_1376401 [Hydnum rufescens UP504]
MGRTKTIVASKGFRANASPSKSKKNVPQPLPTPALVNKAQSLMGEMNYELARRFIQRILEIEPNHVEAREMLGIIEIEEGNVDDARTLFTSLVPPSQTAPSPPSYSAYLYLAQLTDSDPRHALSQYQAAVDLLLLLIKGKERIEPSELDDADRNSDAALRRTVISALVAMVEIWMSSDLCYEPDAEQTCDALVTLAINSDPGNVEALECLGSVRMSQSRPDEARQALEKAWKVLKELEPDDPRIPPLPTRLSLTRRFLELSLFSQALSLIQSILASDDEEIDAWYLQGWCFFLMGEQVKETGENIARDCLEACRTFYRQGGHDDQELIDHVEVLIKSLETAGFRSSPDNGDEVVDSAEEDWEDDDETGPDVEMG